MSTALFTTGRRAATVFFDQSDVHTDGDPGLNGAGDFVLTFEAGDARQESSRVERRLHRDIDADDPPLQLGPVTIPLDLDFRELFLRVTAFDIDFGLLAPFTATPPLGRPRPEA